MAVLVMPPLPPPWFTAIRGEGAPRVNMFWCGGGPPLLSSSSRFCRRACVWWYHRVVSRLC